MRFSARVFLSSKPRLLGLWGNFPPFAPAARESMTCVTSGSRAGDPRRAGEPGAAAKPGLSPPGTF